MKHRCFVVRLFLLLVGILFLVATDAKNEDDNSAGGTSINDNNNRYIVKFKPDRVGNAQRKANQLNVRLDQIVHVYKSAFVGMALKDLTKEQLQELQKDDDVELVEPDGVISIQAFADNVPSKILSDKQPSAFAQGNQTANLVNWGLDRIDDVDGTDNSYMYGFSGDNVTIYILDTGINGNHVDFGGRVAEECWTAYESEGCDDGHGHGTHVAGIAAGLYSGVAKTANIVAVKVLDNLGSGYFSDTVAGLDYVTSTHNAAQASSSGAVINMSLGGRGSRDIIRAAILTAIDSGIVVVVGAGNGYADDACSGTPAFVPEAITVASSALQVLSIAPVVETDTRSDFSSVGPCVDLFAPGSGIYSSSNEDPNRVTSKSGTSMATPFVAGVAALYLQADPSMTPGEVRDRIFNHGHKGIVRDVRGSPNVLLYTGDVGEEPGPTFSPTPLRIDDLSDGVPTEPFSLNGGQSRYFSFEPNSELAVQCTLTGSNGNAGLYLRWNDLPNAFDYDCRSINPFSNEACVVANPGGDSSLFVEVTSFSSFTDVVLECELREQFVDDLLDGVPTEPFSLGVEESRYFSFEPNSELTVQCTLTGSYGDADLYLRWNDLPIGFDYDCDSVGSTSNEACLVDNPGGDSILFVRVFAFSNFNNVELMCETLTSSSCPSSPRCSNLLGGEGFYVHRSLAFRCLERCATTRFRLLIGYDCGLCPFDE